MARYNLSLVNGVNTSDLYIGNDIQTITDRLGLTTKKCVHQGKSYNITRYKKSDLKTDSIHTSGLFRSVVSKDGNIHVFSPPKGLTFREFMKVHPLNEGQGPPKEFRFYVLPENTFEIINKEWVLFTFLTSIAYAIHLFWICWGVDAYSSYERHMICADNYDRDSASAEYDIYILIVIAFHMIEWIRHTIFATSALVGVNLVGVPQN